MGDQSHHLTPYNMQVFDEIVERLYADVPAGLHTMHDRIVYFSQQCLGRPYLFDACGEGPSGRFDQSPVYRFDWFDCLTFVNTVLALSMSDDLSSFQRNLVRVTYQQGERAYHRRHYFMGVDWNVSNAALGLVEDMTAEVAVSSQLLQASAWIDRPAYFRHKTVADLQLLTVQDDAALAKRLSELHALADDVIAEQSLMTYIPISVLVSERGEANEAVFQKIPQSAVVEIVRPNWPMKEKLGTNMNVSHLGFAIWKEGALYLRHAGSIAEKVLDERLADYLMRFRDSETVKGIHVQRVCG